MQAFFQLGTDSEDRDPTMSHPCPHGAESQDKVSLGCCEYAVEGFLEEVESKLASA